MHQRHLDKIQADKNRAQEEENKRIAVSSINGDERGRERNERQSCVI